MHRVAATGLLVLLVVFRVEAQEPRRTGITMGYPESVGLVVHVSDRLAVRPELTFSRHTSESSFPPIGASSTNETWAIGAGVSGLFYVHRWDKLRAYLSPRYTYSRTSGTSELSIPNVIVIEGPALQGSETKTSSHSIFGSFGAEYHFHDHFSVFGEVGLGYTHGRAEGTEGGTRLTSNSWGTRTGAGVAFYF